MNSKIAIIGAGFVGSSAAYAIPLAGIARELVLIDIMKEKAAAEVLDINDGIQFMHDIKIKSGDMDAIADADIIVITAGLARKPGETRLDLIKKNTDIFKNSIIPELKKHYKGGIIFVVANPVDILTYHVIKEMNLPKGKVFGAGTNLDTMRLVYRLSEILGVSTKSINGYVLGEHGDSSFVTWNTMNVGGIKLDGNVKAFNHNFDQAEKERIEKEMRAGGATVIKGKGATYYAIAISIVTICKAVLFDEKLVLPVGIMMDGLYGVNDIVVSLP